MMGLIAPAAALSFSPAVVMRPTQAARAAVQMGVADMCAPPCGALSLLVLCWPFLRPG